ncbi:uncharacterized protein CTHT_0069230 [Thermochaetoides thermophila DSM 1495]|uniref:Aminoglycoside phosphotransferase domain-containing protein n=1 Tax=Chaetomium thermophilum (strain DSM 1495 / CBS 144.50 / IMI 039719) TaxID=759272 RepID=G0SH97_CHATD|nr:hypothetical protein CTHT_0069230 [Thermochaetoides thermophila DSM 1495]EGS17586.1 hypothetical protein CTHT_0069230 [Thermochaetoides thermophila DSM 1495]
MSRRHMNRFTIEQVLDIAEVIHSRGSRKVWRIGDYILKQTPYEGVNNEVATLRFVQQHTTIPVPVVYDEWLSPDRRFHYILESRIPGKSLKQCWGVLSRKGRERIARTVLKYMQELSQFRSDRLESISSNKLRLNNFVPKPYKVLLNIWRTDNDIFDNEYRPALLSSGVDDGVILVLKNTMPPCQGQYTLTHGDLFTGNIIVDPVKEQVTGIIDWESAGFWPAWFQYARITLGAGGWDDEWKALLSRAMKATHLPPHSKHGRIWWDAVYELLDHPGSSLAREWIKEIIRYLAGENVSLNNYDGFGL